MVEQRGLRGPRDLRVPVRTIAAEAVLAVVLVTVAGVVGNAQPASEARFVDAGPEATSGPMTHLAQDLQETFALAPLTPGDSTASVVVQDTRRPSPGQVLAVTMHGPDGTELGLSPLPDGRWTTPVVDLRAGTSTWTVDVVRGGLPTTTTTFTPTVPPTLAPSARVVSRHPWGDLLRLLAGVLALAALGTGIGVGLRTRARSRRLAELSEKTAVTPDPSVPGPTR